MAEKADMKPVICTYRRLIWYIHPGKTPLSAFISVISHGRTPTVIMVTAHTADTAGTALTDNTV